ncbi:tRNA threonylcarbamoyladenosine biosynthesis protein TsaE [Thermosporothrix hazakensis]|jgi:tRNA threonylcarbamoyladenosine biosynthesis protein TsaE|uniref:tRNA threonylcarbamoyladenosine biosynthesis protein TsaE n=2 Tax=Thermosporothrix TaxID=768650 RepID=A0A326UBH5_THEHA|nr:tRNA (adenosine(37)-N6)-threonylcarbamoyltransferase complex ATPase subunit type 1 TsaE [Thermosporothrix hazakensis]PZW33038.1 tRNA threonylcarbamoyladenosine biosynthesis protein TsaE [Thermosporothrix hazakensis]BBH91019.1 tRNA (adenosine(37)-N6)-threonylcarbamoyltransferase complex ATPase subunit type 1 TsaE [Thermosporothrix sp. COM3]GCE49070.1 tRNA (adenosine(37)-N6)-threonylcarbamoyltransferase complex ATPase subunit type 1 TsaE [Thermosporothrix hazakensis]
MVTGQLQKETLTYISKSAEETQRSGERLGTLLQGGELILFEGTLGTGKTTFTQGIARGLGITTNISSPTFTLLKEYPGQPREASGGKKGPALYHFDLYRLDDPEEIFDLGFDDYFYGSGVCVVEWAGNAQGHWPTECLYIRLSVLGETERELAFTAIGERYRELLQQFKKSI